MSTSIFDRQLHHDRPFLSRPARATYVAAKILGYPGAFLFLIQKVFISPIRIILLRRSLSRSPHFTPSLPQP